MEYTKIMVIWHWFLTVTGVTDPTWYNWWSGIVGDFGLLGIFALGYKKLNCHVDGCRRIGLHHVGQYTVCRRHHPDTPKRVTMVHIIKAHKKENP